MANTRYLYYVDKTITQAGRYAEELEKGFTNFVVQLPNSLGAEDVLALSGSTKTVGLYASDTYLADGTTKVTVALPKTSTTISGKDFGSKVNIAGFGQLQLDNSTVGCISVAERLMGDLEGYVPDNGMCYTGGFSYVITSKGDNDTTTYSATPTAAGSATLNNSFVEELQGYLDVSVNAGSLGIARAGKLSVSGSEKYSSTGMTLSDKTSVTASGTFTAKGNAELFGANFFDKVDLGASVLSGTINGGKYTNSVSYSSSSTAKGESTSYSAALSLAAAGTAIIGKDATANGGIVANYATVKLEGASKDFTVNGGSSKDTVKGKGTDRDAANFPDSITLERYATGTVTVDGASVLAINGYDKVTVTGSLTNVQTLNRDYVVDICEQSDYPTGIRQESCLFSDYVNYKGEGNDTVYSGKVVSATKYASNGAIQSMTNTYTAKKGGTLTATGGANIENAIGYTTVTLTDASVTDTLKVYSLAKSVESGESYKTMAITSAEETAAGKLTMTDATAGTIYGYATLKATNDSSITGGASVVSKKITVSKGVTTKTLKAVGTATLTNSYFFGDISGYATVTLTGASCEKEGVYNAADIIGGTRTTVYGGTKDADTYDVQGTLKATNSIIGSVYGMKTITLTNCTAGGISTESSYVTDAWDVPEEEQLVLTPNAKLAATATLTDCELTGGITGVATVNVKNTAASKTAEAGESSFAFYQGTAGADKVTFTNGKVTISGLDALTRAVEPVPVASTVMDFGNGKNTFTIAKATDVTVAGNIVFGNEANTMSLAADASLAANNIDFGNGKATFSTAKGCVLTAADMSFGISDDKVTFTESLVELDNLAFEGGKDTITISKNTLLKLSGDTGLTFGSSAGMTLKQSGEICFGSKDGIKALNDFQGKATVDKKTAYFTASTSAYAAADDKSVLGVALYDIGASDAMDAYRGFAAESADDTVKGAKTLSSLLEDGYYNGWLSDDDGSGRYLNDSIDFFNVDDLYNITSITASDNVTLSYYDAKGNLLNTKSYTSSAAFVSASIADDAIESGAFRYTITIK